MPLYFPGCDEIAVTSDSSASESDVGELIVDGCGSPRLQRRRKRIQFARRKKDRDQNSHSNVYEQMYDENLPEVGV